MSSCASALFREKAVAVGHRAVGYGARCGESHTGHWCCELLGPTDCPPTTQLVMVLKGIFLSCTIKNPVSLAWASSGYCFANCRKDEQNIFVCWKEVANKAAIGSCYLIF